MVYVYKIIKENTISGKQQGDPMMFETDQELAVGSLYLHLPGTGGGRWRVLELITKLQEVGA